MSKTVPQVGLEPTSLCVRSAACYPVTPLGLGGASGNRTHNLWYAMPVRCQLRYDPIDVRSQRLELWTR